MPTIPKPRWNSRTGNAFSCYASLAPSKDEAEELAKKIQSMIGIQVPSKIHVFENVSAGCTVQTVVTFNDYLRRLICRYRTGYYLAHTHPKRGEVERALNRIEKTWRTEGVEAAMRLINQADHTTYHLLWDALPLCNAGAFYDPDSEEQLDALFPQALAHAKDNLKYISTGRGSPRFWETKVQLAEDVAMTFLNLGLNPTKARNGLFDKVLTEIFSASRYEYENVPIGGSTREDNFKILREAIDAIENATEEMFSCWSEDILNFGGIS